MSRILLLANLNCDHVLSLAEPLVAGARLQYVDQGRRLGGGAANTGIGLVWAGHEVIIASRIGLDETGDWLLEQAAGHGLDCSHVERFGGETGELLVLVDSTGERTILRRPRRPDLPGDLPLEGVDCLYVNYPGTAIIGYMRQMLGKSFVVAQYPKGGQARRPCHVLVASRADLAEVTDPWQHARQLAGDQLEWLVLTEGKAGAVAIHGEEQLDGGGGQQDQGGHGGGCGGIAGILHVQHGDGGEHAVTRIEEDHRRGGGHGVDEQIDEDLQERRQGGGQGDPPERLPERNTQ